MKRLWDSLYDKVKAMIEGYVASGAAAAVVLSVTNSADVTDLSPAAQTAWSLGVAAIVGVLNQYRRPETKDPMRDHHIPGDMPPA